MVDLLLPGLVAAIVIPVAYSLLRRRYVSLGIALACGAASAVLLLYVGLVGNRGVGPDVMFSPENLSTMTHLGSMFISIFLHESLVHLAFNVAGLVIFGLMLEERAGGWRTLVTFLLGALAGEMFYSLFYPGSAVRLIGASGGIMAIVGAFARLYPYERLSILGMSLLLRDIPAWAVAFAFLTIDLTLAIVSEYADLVLFGGRVAYIAHVGGLIAGFAAAPLLSRVKVERTVDEIDPDAVRRVIRDDALASDIIASITGETDRDIVGAWLTKLERNARCPGCGGRMDLRRHTLRCGSGHEVRLAR